MLVPRKCSFKVKERGAILASIITPITFILFTHYIKMDDKL